MEYRPCCGLALIAFSAASKAARIARFILKSASNPFIIN
jgi:hypothetical protein